MKEILQQILYEIQSANSSIDWYAIASTIATVFLGAIAIWQNHRYKKQSDKFQEELQKPYLYISESGSCKKNVSPHKEDMSGLRNNHNFAMRNIGRENIVDMQIISYSLNGTDIRDVSLSRGAHLDANEFAGFAPLLSCDNRIQKINIVFKLRTVWGTNYMLEYYLETDDTDQMTESYIKKTTKEAD